MKAFAALSLLLISCVSRASGYVPPEAAFGLDLASLGPGRYLLEANVLPGFALYQDKLRVEAKGATIRSLRVPAGTLIDDPELGPERILEGYVSIPLEVTVQSGSPAPELVVRYMGCKTGELCYPPQTMRFPLQPVR